MDSLEAKRLAARAAAELLPDEGVIGLGTGSTAELFIEAMAEQVRAGKRLLGVPTSEGCRARALDCGLELLSDVGPWAIDLCVDGADEVSESLDVIKGGGACHMWEKIVNHAARKNVIVVDESKLSGRLGERFMVPVEVLPFGHRTTRELLTDFGVATLRMEGTAVRRTDSGNVIYDLKVGPIADPAALDGALLRIPGVLGTGIFHGCVDLVICAGSQGIRQLHPSRARSTPSASPAPSR